MTARIGVIGAGRHSTAYHGPALQYLAEQEPGRVELAAVCDLSADAAVAYARKFGFARTYTDWTAMLEAEQLDGLIAVTPLAATLPVASALLPYQIPVMIEKPPGQNVTETEKLLACAREFGTGHMVSFNRRFNPAVRAAREWIEADPDTRQPQLALGRMLRVNRREPEFVIGTGLHLIDVVVSLLGTPQVVSSIRVRSASGDGDGGDAFTAQVDVEGGRSAGFLIAPVAGVEEETIELYGDGFCLRIDVQDKSLTLHEQGKLVWEWREPDSPHRRFNDTIAETESFVSAIEGRQPFAPDLVTSLDSMRVAEAIQYQPTAAR